MYYLYKITNPKGKIYIGCTKNIIKRFSDYRRYNCKKQKLLYNSLIKYKHETHKFEIILKSKNNLFEKEQLFIEFFNSNHYLNEKGLNLYLGGLGGSKVIKPIYQYSLDGYFTGKVFTKKEDFEELELNHQCVKNCCIGQKNYYKNYSYRWFLTYEKLEIKTKRKKRKGTPCSNEKKNKISIANKNKEKPNHRKLKITIIDLVTNTSNIFYGEKHVNSKYVISFRTLKKYANTNKIYKKLNIKILIE